MSAAPAAEAAPAAPPAGNKKLVIILAATLVLVLIGSGVGFFMLSKKKPAEGEEGDGHGEPKAKAEAHGEPAKSSYDPKHPPTFVPLEPFTVNLADKNAERFAQVSVTLEIDDAKLGDQIKNFMPAIRNNILLVIADRTAGELMSREGKAKLAERMRRASARGLGFSVDDLEDDEEEEATDTPKKKKKKKKSADVALPIRAVHFTNIIIQ